MRVSFFLEKIFCVLWFLFVGYSNDEYCLCCTQKGNADAATQKHRVFLPAFVQVKSGDFLKIKTTPRHHDLFRGFPWYLHLPASKHETQGYSMISGEESQSWSFRQSQDGVPTLLPSRFSPGDKLPYNLFPQSQILGNAAAKEADKHRGR